MSDYTEHYNLKKPLKTESYDVDVANTNNDIIDEKIYGKVDKMEGKELSTNDFTNGYKKKLDLLSNYDDAPIIENIKNLDKAKVDKKDFERLKKENELLKENQLYGGANGKNINLQDSAKAYMKIKLKGSTNQSTRSGKNIFNKNAEYSYTNTPNTLTITTLDTDRKSVV